MQQHQYTQDLGTMPRGFAFALQNNGWSVWETGGGCTAWRKEIGDRLEYLLLTSDGNHIIGERDVVDVGLYDENGECILCVSGKLSDFTAPRLVGDVMLEMPFSAALPQDILDLPADTDPGIAIIDLCTPAVGIAASFDEHELQEQFTGALVKQCEAWVHSHFVGPAPAGQTDDTSPPTSPDVRYVRDVIKSPEHFRAVDTVLFNANFSGLHADVLACPADSVVGRACVQLLNATGSLLTMRYEDGGLEDDVAEAIAAAAIRQCHVWYFG